jgi:hypothetical protein
LQDDLDFLDRIGLNDAAAGTNAVFFRGGGFHLESNTIASGVGQLHSNWDVLTELKSVKLRGKEGILGIQWIGRPLQHVYQVDDEYGCEYALERELRGRHCNKIVTHRDRFDT